LYELTLDSAAGSMWRWNVDSPTVTASTSPISDTTAPSATTATGSPSASSASGRKKISIAAVAKTSGRRGFARSAITPPASPPTPDAATIVAHAVTPPRSRSATSGPTIAQQP
jgi:hypothetical protein